MSRPNLGVRVDLPGGATGLPCGATGLRPGIGGLVALAHAALHGQPANEPVVAFRGRRGDRLKRLG